MQRKRIAIFLAVLMVATVLSGCSGDKKAAEGNGSSENARKVAMITNDTINDGGWNAACYAGMCEAAKEYGFETSYTEKVAESDYASTFTEYANMGFDLIFAPGNEYTDAILEVAPSFPDVNFVVLNGEISGDNYSSIKCDNVQMGFLAGVLAGLKTKTGNVGYVGAIEITTALDNINGFEQGAAYVNPDTKVHVAWTNSWTDTAKGKEVAISMITTNNVDVFYGNAGTIDVGVREAAKQYEERYAVAQPAESLDQDPDIILNSVITDNAALIGMAMKAVVEGSFGNSIYEGGVAEGVLSIGKFGTNAEDIKDDFNKIYEDLKAGKIGLK